MSRWLRVSNSIDLINNFKDRPVGEKIDILVDSILEDINSLFHNHELDEESKTELSMKIEHNRFELRKLIPFIENKLDEEKRYQKALMALNMKY